MIFNRWPTALSTCISPAYCRGPWSRASSSICGRVVGCLSSSSFWRGLRQCHIIDLLGFNVENLYDRKFEVNYTAYTATKQIVGKLDAPSTHTTLCVSTTFYLQLKCSMSMCKMIWCSD
ncbi:hypothetical protein PISMIDRAFT_551783 [Pisolithus microcarpus 441]|uniref:Uncharacterized protein n=1 Tax=Pisolithus microcarpus 441 TaxID=765257 RepID=A0A0C9ZHJ4_9AGAM|nr:hypothetical protein PISMIDRAFT_551783 [Pisolithus microcarpus 441]